MSAAGWQHGLTLEAYVAGRQHHQAATRRLAVWNAVHPAVAAIRADPTWTPMRAASGGAN